GERQRSWDRTERECPFTGVAERVPRARLELGRLLTRRTRELECCSEVMGEHLSAVLGAAAAERIDPLGGKPMLVRATCSRDLRVGNIAHEQVPEGVLALARHRAAPLAADELLALERVQPLLDRPTGFAAD